MRALAALRAYGTHPDPATQAVNGVALLVGSNGPFYPVYVWILAPEAGPAALATMAASPLFLLVPWLSQRHGAAARAALPAIGIANTVWTCALLGPGTAVVAFIFPCLVLALLCWREGTAMLGLLGVALVTQQVLLRWPWAALSGLEADSQAALAAMNATSAGALVAFIAYRMAGLLRVVAVR